MLLLVTAADGLCFYRQDGLWTYEVCHRKHVRQFSQVRLQTFQGISVESWCCNALVACYRWHNSMQQYIQEQHDVPDVEPACLFIDARTAEQMLEQPANSQISN